MSHTTRCPACRTQFLVTPDQLALAQGWVRCGTCAEIFDAAAHALAAEGNVTSVLGPDAGLAAPLVSAVQALPDERYSGPPKPTFGEPSSAFEASTIATNVAPEASAAGQYVQHRDYSQDVVFGVQPLQDPLVFETEEQAQLRELQELDFVRDAQRQAFWGQPAVLLLGALVCLLLGSLLAAQIALHERDRLAAHSPAAAPWLAAACEHLQCQLAPLRQIESLVIDHSSFNKAPGDFYRFNLSVKNTSGVALAMPAVELTLTDTLDQAQVRRVLLPTELGAPLQLAANGEWSASLPVTLPQDVRVAGYRALVFYP